MRIDVAPGRYEAASKIFGSRIHDGAHYPFGRTHTHVYQHHVGKGGKIFPKCTGVRASTTEEQLWPTT